MSSRHGWARALFILSFAVGVLMLLGIAGSARCAFASTEDFESGGLTHLPWITTDGAEWSVTTTTQHGGMYAVEAPVFLNDNQYSSIQATLECAAGTISFWYSVSSEKDFDNLHFFIDGEQQGIGWSGSVPWTKASYNITAGVHTFIWSYSKDGSVSSGSDTVWIDDIAITTQTPHCINGVQDADETGVDCGGADCAMCQSPPLIMASVNVNGLPGNNDSGGPSLSYDGRYISFSSDASDLVAGDTNGVGDAFVRDLISNTTERVSVDNNGAEANGSSGPSSISSDGRYVAFMSYADNLVACDTNGYGDEFVRDRQAGTTTRVSVASDGTEANGNSYFSMMTDDGRYVIFTSEATNLVPDDTNGQPDLFLHDMTTGETKRVSLDTNGNQFPYPVYFGAIDPNGRYVVFYTVVDGAGVPYKRDLLTNTTVEIEWSDYSYDPALPWVSDSGRFDIIGYIMNGIHIKVVDCVVRNGWEILTGPWNSTSGCGRISGDGSKFAFMTEISYAPADTNNHSDVYYADNPFYLSASHCSNGVQDAGETGIDCGSKDCAACPDTTPPTSTITAPANGATLTGASQAISGTALDTFSGVQIVEVGVTPNGGTETWYTATGTTSWSYDWTLPNDGSYTIRSRAADIAGNVEEPGGGITVTVDNDPPTGTVSINGGAASTTTTAVSLTLSGLDAGSGVSQMQLSNDGVFDTEPYEAYATFRAWGLTAGAGAKTVTVRFKDGAGNVSAPISDSITYNPPCATPASLTVPASKSTGTYTVSWGASSTGGAAYSLQEATNSTFTTGVRTAYTGTTLTTSITGRALKTTYYYRVKATKTGYNASVWRTAANGCAVGGGACATPSSITVPATGTTTSYTVRWGASATAGVTYSLQEATNSTFTTGLRTAYTGTTLSKAITARIKGKTYYYRVKATKTGATASAWKTAANGCRVQ